MTRYTKYDADTGQVEYIFEGRSEELHLHQPCLAGEYPAKEYTIVDGSPVRKSQTDIDQVDIDRAWIELRNRRNGYLADCDWTQAADAPLTDAQKADWATYRVALRNLPANTADPRTPTWPDKP